MSKKIEQYLSEAKVSGLGLEVEVLICYVLKKDKTWLFLNKNFEISDENCAKLNKFIAQLVDGLPLAYITELKEFYGYEFYVNSNVLIPRPDTELLVELAIKRVGQFFGGLKDCHFVELGIGSGCVSISILNKLIEQGFDTSNISLFGIDVSEDALKVASTNLNKFNLTNKITLVQGDLLSPLEWDFEIDLLIANLPYLSIADSLVEENVKKFEPGTALFSENDGLDHYFRMFSQVTEFVKPPKCILIEIGFNQADQIVEFIQKKLPLYKVIVHKDLAQNDRVVELQSLYCLQK